MMILGHWNFLQRCMVFVKFLFVGENAALCPLILWTCNGKLPVGNYSIHDAALSTSMPVANFPAHLSPGWQAPCLLHAPPSVVDNVRVAYDIGGRISKLETLLAAEGGSRASEDTTLRGEVAALAAALRCEVDASAVLQVQISSLQKAHALLGDSVLSLFELVALLTRSFDAHQGVADAVFDYTFHNTYHGNEHADTSAFTNLEKAAAGILHSESRIPVYASNSLDQSSVSTFCGSCLTVRSEPVNGWWHIGPDEYVRACEKHLYWVPKTGYDYDVRLREAHIHYCKNLRASHGGATIGHNVRIASAGSRVADRLRSAVSACAGLEAC